MINTNIVGLHILTKLYLSDMKKKNSGHILNVASIARFMSGPLMATYYATKNYVVRLSEAIRVELKNLNLMLKLVYYVQDLPILNLISEQMLNLI